MNKVEELILKRGEIKSGNILKVDSFLNHQIEIDALEAIADAFAEYFSQKDINKILTIESSGIAIAVALAQRLKLPVVFAKKAESLNLDAERYSTRVYSFTKQKEYNVQVSKKYLCADDKVLIVDDFLALGSAAKGLIELCNQAGALVEGIGIVIEKAFQNGGKELRVQGYDVLSLAMIERFNEDGSVSFCSR